MMRKSLVSLVALVAMLGSLMISFPAEAGHRDWVVGTGFHIGHMSFQLVFRDSDRGRPNYYYRTGGHFRESRHRCTDRCFKEDNHYFHDAYCPRMLSHLEGNHYNPYDIFERYAPRHDGYSRHGNNHRGPQWRDDRRDDSWRWRSYRGHRHHGSCRHRH